MPFRDPIRRIVKVHWGHPAATFLIFENYWAGDGNDNCRIHRSTDGINWNTTNPSYYDWGGYSAYGNGMFAIAAVKRLSGFWPPNHYVWFNNQVITSTNFNSWSTGWIGTPGDPNNDILSGISWDEANNRFSLNHGGDYTYISNPLAPGTVVEPTGGWSYPDGIITYDTGSWPDRGYGFWIDRLDENQQEYWTKTLSVIDEGSSQLDIYFAMPGT